MDRTCCQTYSTTKKRIASMNRFSISAPAVTDFGITSNLEWLETNGIGGYCCSTVSGAHTRKYHALLVASTEPPVGRKAVLSKLEETVVVGDQRYELGAN